MSVTSGKVTQHKEFYLRGGDLHFLVESALFRVHSYFFDRDSSYFRQRLLLGTPAGEGRAGSSDKSPFVLEGIKSTEFETFLWVFYNPKYSLYDTTIEEWTTILRLAVLWDFFEVKKLAIRHLQTLPIPPITKIAIYETYDVHRSYLASSYAAITSRAEPLTVQEGLVLGLETSLRLAQARERLRAFHLSHKPQWKDEEVEEVVKDIFGVGGTAAFAETVHAAPAAKKIVKVDPEPVVLNGHGPSTPLHSSISQMASRVNGHVHTTDHLAAENKSTSAPIPRSNATAPADRPVSAVYLGPQDETPVTSEAPKVVDLLGDSEAEEKTVVEEEQTSTEATLTDADPKIPGDLPISNAEHEEVPSVNGDAEHDEAEKKEEGEGEDDSFSLSASSKKKKNKKKK